MGVVALVRSIWVLSYAVVSAAGLLLTGVAITGLPTKSRTANVVLSLLSNHMSELPWTVILLDVGFYIWLSITGTAIRLFNYVNVISVAGLLYLFKRSIDSKATVDNFLNQLSKDSRTCVELPGPNSPRFWRQFLNPLHWPENYTFYEDIPYWVSTEQMPILRSESRNSILQMVLDVYRPNKVQGGDDRPVFLYIHGGGWTSGSKKWTGPILSELLSREWIVVSTGYRLNYKDGYPTQLIDCKRALRWIKDEIRIFGGDPQNIVVGGDSAGGHLAALLALTPNLPEFQPGFEKVDTTVQGCVPQSASMDLMDMKNYNHYNTRARFIKEVARREGSAESEENLKFLTEHSPIFKINGTSVPFLVVHGSLDTMIPVQFARDFAQKFQKESNAKFNYLEIPYGHHAFHVFPSPRTWYTVIATAEWLAINFDRHEPGKQTSAANESRQKVQVHELVEWGWSNDE
ncbi:hypothetical protein BGZ65_001364 [Modicella reniformis]|uniref:BD-FAE-like domain-containing protein n=1 Tax=Modicella reniformis TaxID=1440133 RepID=A0A9P6J6C8_9FUNG|nr:hypothetical protein BGZ65_001364 [Modicella reniformis]